MCAQQEIFCAQRTTADLGEKVTGSQEKSRTSPRPFSTNVHDHILKRYQL